MISSFHEELEQKKKKISYFSQNTHKTCQKIKKKDHEREFFNKKIRLSYSLEKKLFHFHMKYPCQETQSLISLMLLHF